MNLPYTRTIIVVCFVISALCLSCLDCSAQSASSQHAPKWAVALATAGPLADGLTTYYALQQPNVIEGNGFYTRLFGANVKPGEILAFKVGQAALTGAVVYAAGKKDRKAAIGAAVAMAAINFTVSAMNVRNAQQAKRLNEGRR